jgi:hypothetical protein
MAENSRIGSVTQPAAPAALAQRRHPASTRRRVVVNQGVAPAASDFRSLPRISPMEHRVEAMLLVLLDFGQTVQPPLCEDVYFAP